jgi:hypothetical protein
MVIFPNPKYFQFFHDILKEMPVCQTGMYWFCGGPDPPDDVTDEK